MKIAIFSDCYLDLTGGITTMINAEKQELEKRGHTVYVFSSAYPRSVRERQKLAKSFIFPVPSCKFIARGLTPIARRPKIVEKWLIKNYPEIKDFDIFYVHYEAGCSIAGLRLAKQYKIPSIQVMHGREDEGLSNIIPFGFRTTMATLLNLFHSWYLPHTVKIHKDEYLANTIAKAKMWTLMINHANFADLVLTPSKHFATKLHHYGVKNRIIALPNGVSDELFLPKLPPRQLKPSEPLRIIWHSRLSSEKRILPFLKAISQIKGKYRLDIYGSGGEFWRAKHFAKSHRLNVVFHGNTSFNKVYHEILKNHLDVLVSFNSDTFGMTLIEAESLGVPTLIADPDLKEVVPSGGYILSDNPSPEAIANSLEDLLRHPEKIEKMSRLLLGHRDVVKISRRIDKLEKIFRNAIINS